MEMEASGAAATAYRASVLTPRIVLRSHGQLLSEATPPDGPLLSEVVSSPRDEVI